MTRLARALLAYVVARRRVRVQERRLAKMMRRLAP